MTLRPLLLTLSASMLLASPVLARGVARGGDAVLGITADVALTLTDLGLMRGWEQQKQLAAVVKDQGWRADGAKGKLVLDDGTTLTAQVFGTWVAKSNTFSWAWASAPPSVPSASYAQASKARFLGGAHGFEQLTAPHQKMTRDEALALAITTSGALEQVHGVFLAPTKFGAVLLAVTDFKLELPESTVASAADAVYSAIDSGMVVNQREAVREYLEDRGFSVEGDAMTWTATHAHTGTLRVSYSPAGRVTGIACLGVGSLECRVSDAKLAAADAKAARMEDGVAETGRADRARGKQDEAASDPAVQAFGDLSSEDMDALLAGSCGPNPCPGEDGTWWAGFWFGN